MDYSEDVERLFSWLKAPMVHYREFAPEAELSEAVATWPAVHKAAVETGVAGDHPAPQGDAVAHQRNARRRMTLMPVPTDDRTAAGASPPTPGRLDDRPTAVTSSDTQSEATAHPALTIEPSPLSEPSIPSRELPDAGPARIPSPQRVTTEEQPRPDHLDRRYYSGHERGALFGGEYRERGRVQPDERTGERQDRALDAVFSRLSGGRDRLPDPRVRARTTAGLGSVFNRLR